MNYHHITKNAQNVFNSLPNTDRLWFYTTRLTFSMSNNNTIEIIFADRADEKLTEKFRDLMGRGRLKSCRNCGDYYMVRGDDYYQYCNRCLESAHHCELCDDPYFGRYCTHCFFTCDSCGEVLGRDSESSNHRGVCYDCEERFTCSECGDFCYSEDDLSDHMDRYHNNTSQTIHNYGYKPRPKFLSVDGEKTKRFFGVEIEMEFGGNEKAALDNLCYCDDKYYLKEDGSLSDGVELVTHPATLKYYQNGFLSDELETLLSAGYKSHDCSTCGLHIHVSKNSAKLSTWVKVAMFWYEHEEMIKKVCRRGYGHYCIKKDVKGIPSKDVTKSYTRYESINFQNNHTVEFRQPKGTLQYKTLLATITFVDLLIKWSDKQTPQHVISKQGKTDFIEYVKKHSKSCYGYLNSKGVY